MCGGGIGESAYNPGSVILCDTNTGERHKHALHTKRHLRHTKSRHTHRHRQTDVHTPQKEKEIMRKNILKHVAPSLGSYEVPLYIYWVRKLDMCKWNEQKYT